jgi:replicative DNA helicase
VLFPYREAYYLERAEPKDTKKRGDWEMACAEMHRRMDVIAAKVRQGAVGTDHQTYFAEFDHVEDVREDGR